MPFQPQGHSPIHGNKMAMATVINAAVMFFVTYALIWQPSHFYPNLNRLYMTGMMVAPMVAVMWALMWPQATARANLGVVLGALLVFGLALALARGQMFVGERTLLRSMIPHHSSAILMCERAQLQSPEVLALCDEIVEAQQREITRMQALLAAR